MHAKRGQVTIFIILGLILLASIGVFVYYSSPSEQEIPEVLDQATITQYVNTCLEETGKQVLDTVAIQGGMYQPVLFKTFEGTNISYWCYGESPNQCVNAIFTKKDLASQIIYGIKQEIDSCVDFHAFEKQGYTITQGNLDGTASIKDEEVEISITYPLKIKKENQEISVESFQADIKTPLGQLYNIAHDILNQEAQYEEFDLVPYAVNHTDITIQKNKPYPSIIYTIQKGETILQFAVQGVETVGTEVRFGSETLYGCCYVDSACYANTPNTVCTEKQGTYESSPCSCDNAKLQNTEQTLCNGNECSGCKMYDHGQSWCDYDGETGKGKDAVGSRQYLYSCVNGEVVHEACRDYREEICVQSGDTARCRANRWQDCSACTTKDCCENRENRDCYWNEELSSINAQCVPYVPPGFKFWEYNGLEYCSLANTQQTCSGLSCSQEVVDQTAVSCYSQGDCGNYRNAKGTLTEKSFFNSNFRYDPSEDIYDVAEYADPLVLPLYVAKQQPLLTAPVTQAADIFIEMITAAYQFINQWVDITVPNYLNPFTKNPKIEVMEVSICLPWQPQNSGDSCTQCGSSGRPCTEYQCKSLGKKCVYEEVNGYPVCSAVSKDKQKKFSLNLTSIPSGYSAEKSVLGIDTVNYSGYTITPALTPYELFTVTVQTSAESICHLDYTPRAEYLDPPMFMIGDMQYTKDHVLTVRVPPRVVIPTKLKEGLNLTTAEQMVRAIMEPEDLLENYETKFPAVFSVYKTVTGNDLAEELEPSVDSLLDVMDTVESSYPYYENLSITVMDKFDNGGYYLFISCEDKYGNEQQQELFLDVAISNNTHDVTPPSIVEFDPDNGAKIPGASTTQVTIFTNEPADCHYDTINKPYAEMENAFTCNNGLYDLVAVAGGSYECTTTVADPDLYISCADNPGNENTYSVVLQYSNTTAIEGKLSSPYIPEDEENPLEEYAAYISMNETENAINIAVSSYLLSEHPTTFNISKQNVSLHIYVDHGSECVLNNGTVSQNMYCTDSSELQRGEYVCDANLTVAEIESTQIICKEKETDQNIMQPIHYVVSEAEPLVIQSIIPKNNEEVGSETALAVTTSMSEAVDCGYASYGSLEYVALEKVSETLFTGIVRGLDQGYNTYSVYCTDSYGNKAEQVVSWYVK